MFFRACGAGFVALALLSCARQPTTTPTPSGAASRLPPVPEVRGPLALGVVYPPAGAIVDVRDSSFIFGTAGSGDAQVTVNGVPALVWPNGAWVAWLPFPRDSLMHFDLVARRGADSTRLDWVVRRPVRFTPPPAPVWIDSTSLAPRGRVWAGAGEYIPLSARAAEGATVRLRLPDGTLVPLSADTQPIDVPDGIRAFDRDTQNLATQVRADRYRGVLRGRRVGPDPGPVLRPIPAPAPVDTAVAAALKAPAPSVPPPPVIPSPGSPSAAVAAAPDDFPVLEAIRGADTARVRWPLSVSVLDTLPVVAELNDDLNGRGGTDSITYGRAAPGATYVWPFPTGTRALVSGRVNDDLRLRLAPGLDAWISAADAHPLPPGTPAPRATIGSLTLSPAPQLGRTSVRIPVGQRLPFQVEERDGGLRLRLYGAVGNLNWIRYGPVTQDSLVRRLEWHQEPGDQVVIDLSLAAPLWGYRARWDRNDLVLDIRRPPPIEPSHPLKDRLIVVDPGHPPAGATGPTGLAERDANLAVALRLRDRLRDAGARVIMTREQDTPVDLWSRVKLTDSVDADLLVSIHNNALPDGVNPFTNNGTSVFYNHPRSLPLARAIQAALLRHLGLRDLGVARADLALARPAWMPAVLCEGLFLMLPDQEHALRTQEGQEAYAKGVAEGIEAYLREVAAQVQRAGAGIGASGGASTGGSASGGSAK